MAQNTLFFNSVFCPPLPLSALFNLREIEVDGNGVTERERERKWEERESESVCVCVMGGCEDIRQPFRPLRNVVDLFILGREVESIGNSTP